MKPEIRTKPIPQKSEDTKSFEARSNALWWQEHRTDQRFLLKPQYESRYAMSDKSEWHTKEDFTPYTINRLINICKGVDNKERFYRPEDPKSSMPGFAVGSVKEDFYETNLKGENFVTTQILVVDVDEVPKNVTNIGLWLPSVIPPNVFALWYSTPRWRESSKRIRVVIPLTRPISMAEKQSMATRLPIPGADPASFEAAKFSLLPCWCEDTVDFKWGVVGHKHLNPDADLPVWIPERKEEWRDAPRLKACSAAMEALEKLVEEINDAPDGHSQEVVKPGLGRIFQKYAVTYGDCEMFANYIERPDREKDFLGIAKWLENKYRK